MQATDNPDRKDKSKRQGTEKEAMLGNYEEAAEDKGAKAEAQPAAKKGAKATAEVKPAKAKPVADAAQLERAGVAMNVDLNGGGVLSRTEQFASFQSDAPSCDNCGNLTVRNGNCYLCHNCGNSMGCS